MYLVNGKRHNKQSYTTTGPPEECETPIKTTVLEMNTNKAYGHVQYKPNEPILLIMLDMTKWIKETDQN